MNVAYFFAMVGTICFFIIYKDFAVSKGVGEYYTMALSGIGIGDLVGRMSTGIMVSSKVSVEHYRAVMTCIMGKLEVTLMEIFCCVLGEYSLATCLILSSFSGLLIVRKKSLLDQFIRFCNYVLNILL